VRLTALIIGMDGLCWRTMHLMNCTQRGQLVPDEVGAQKKRPDNLPGLVA
jgi:hypothetical protein